MTAATVPDVVPLPNRRATRLLARALARSVAAGDLILLDGQLGAGKTFLVRALARALGLPTSVRVMSPTFPLIRELPTEPPIAHADLYRLESTDEARELGLWERRDEGAVLIVEWGLKHRAVLGPDALDIGIELSPRRARLGSDGPRSRQLLAAVRGALSAPRPPSRRSPRDQGESG
jgi:tRNA threonylcarbamoyladenosine biosynthesis protein TsaE